MEAEIRIVETYNVRDEDARSTLWKIYKDAFDRLNERTPIHHGGFCEEQFADVLDDPDFTKFLVHVGRDLVGGTLLTNALEKVPWINAPYFAQRYPKRYADRQLFFLPAVVIDPAHQDLRRIGAKLLQQAVTTLGKDAVLAVDYSETLRHSLPHFVRRGLGITFSGEVLDRLVYQIFYYRDPE